MSLWCFTKGIAAAHYNHWNPCLACVDLLLNVTFHRSNHQTDISKFIVYLLVFLQLFTSLKRYLLLRAFSFWDYGMGFVAIDRPCSGFTFRTRIIFMAITCFVTGCHWLLTTCQLFVGPFLKINFVALTLSDICLCENLLIVIYKYDATAYIISFTPSWELHCYCQW